MNVNHRVPTAEESHYYSKFCDEYLFLDEILEINSESYPIFYDDFGQCTQLLYNNEWFSGKTFSQDYANVYEYFADIIINHP